MQPDGQAAVALLLEELVGAVVPDLDGAGAVLAFRDLSLEAPVVERVVLDVNGQVLLARLERNALRHRPAEEDAVAFQTEVVVEPPRVVALHDEDRILRLPLALEGLRRLLGIAFSLVLAKAHEEAPAR